jgi:hypothetical protein
MIGTHWKCMNSIYTVIDYWDDWHHPGVIWCKVQWHGEVEADGYTLDDVLRDTQISQEEFELWRIK